MQEEPPRRRRPVAAIIAVLAALALIVVSIAPAFAAEEQSFTRFWVEANANPGGDIDVEIDLEFDFGSTPSHGVYLTYVTHQRIDGDPGHYRVLDYSAIVADSPTAPHEVRVERERNSIGIYIGDPETEITGVHEYTVAFTVDGVVNAGAGAGGEDEIYWNVIGTGFDVPMTDVSVSLESPSPPLEVACWAGPDGSTAPCTQSTREDGAARYSQDFLAPGEGVTIVASYPDTFPASEPILEKRWTFANSMGGPVIAGAGGLGMVLAAALVPIGVSYLRRDERYETVPPGATPPEGMGERIGRAPRKIDPPPRLTPPEGLSPAEVGMITQGRMKPSFHAATVVDLAARGHVQITPVQGRKPRWTLTRGPRTAGGNKHPDVTENEERLLNAIFASDTTATLGKLPRSRRQSLGYLTGQDAKRLKEEGWVTTKAHTTQVLALFPGALVVLAGVAAVIYGSFRGWGMLGLPIVAAGVAWVAAFPRVAKRTAAGHAHYVQALGFKNYLDTAEGGQLRVDADRDVFSEYLPYAMVFGIVDRWVNVFQRLAAQGQWTARPLWYGRYAAGAGLFADPGAIGDFTSDLSGLQRATKQAATAGSSAGAAGGSGFSGGGVGGGVGGGGGGSW